MNFRYFVWLLKVLLQKILIRWKITRYRFDLYNTKITTLNNKIFYQIDDIPLITFIILSDDPSKKNYLQETIASIRNQTLNSWKCIVDKSLVEKEDNIDNFLLVNFLNGRILSDDLLSVIDSYYLILIQPGDKLLPNFLEYLASYSSADIVYFDQIFVRGKEKNFFLKPDWSPELWLGVNILDKCIYRVDYLKRFISSNEHNIFSDAVITAKHITHVPEVLIQADGFPWERDTYPVNHKIAITKLLEKMNLDVAFHLKKRSNGSWSILFDENPKKKISIVIPSGNHFDDLSRCLHSLYSFTKYKNFEIIVVDDSSNDKKVLDYYSYLCSKYPNFVVINGSRPFNFSRACNQGAAKATGDFLLFLNNDTEVIDPNWLANLAGVLQIPGVGVVGPKLLYPDGSVQHAGIVIGLEGHASHVLMGVKSDIYTPYGYVDWMRNVSAVTGACMMVRRDVFEQVGGFDESLTLAFGDVDLCLRIIDAGYRIVYTPDVKLIHYEGRSRGKYIPKQDLLAKKDYFREKIKQGDPYYNPNLSRAWRIPTLRQKWEMDPVERYDKLIEFKTR